MRAWDCRVARVRAGISVPVDTYHRWFCAGRSYGFPCPQHRPKLTAGLGQPAVVENRSGAGGNVGAKVAAKSPPDGYTLFIGLTTALVPSPSLYPRLRMTLSRISRRSLGWRTARMCW